MTCKYWSYSNTVMTSDYSCHYESFEGNYKTEDYTVLITYSMQSNKLKYARLVLLFGPMNNTTWLIYLYKYLRLIFAVYFFTAISDKNLRRALYIL